MSAMSIVGGPQPHPRTAVLLTALTAAVALVVPLVPQASVGQGSAGQGSAELVAGAAVAEVDPAIRAAFASADEVGVVVRAPGAAAVAARDAVTGAGGTVGTELPIVEGFAARLTVEGLEALEGIAGVTVSLDGEVRPQVLGGLLGGGGSGSSSETPTTPADSSYVETMGAHKLHKKGFRGKGVGIAILDTGVSEVADLKGRLTGQLDLAADLDHVDHYGHGTFIAGVAAGNGSKSRGEHAGVAPEAHVIPVKITGLDGSSDVSHLLAGIQYAVSFKDTYDIGVMNISLGTNSTQSWKLDLLNFAVQKAWDAGIVVVVSGANLGPSPQTIAKPADDPLVITVGAIDAHATSDRSDDTMTDFSARGPTASGGLAKPDVVAPGVSVVGLRAPNSYVDQNFPGGRVGDHYFRATGTSFATGAVSGAVALLRQAHPDWTPDQIKGALLSTAAPGPVGDPNVDGHGSVDVAKAASLTSPPKANQGVGRSLGTGLLDLSRGDVETVIQKDGLIGWLTSLVEVLLDGDLTAQDQTFDATAFTTTEWSKASWYKASWYKASWYKASWYKASWYDADWWKASWYAVEWQ